MRDLCHFIHPPIAEGSPLITPTFNLPHLFVPLNPINLFYVFDRLFAQHRCDIVNIPRNFPSWLTLSFNLTS